MRKNRLDGPAGFLRRCEKMQIVKFLYHGIIIAAAPARITSMLDGMGMCMCVR